MIRFGFKPNNVKPRPTLNHHVDLTYHGND